MKRIGITLFFAAITLLANTASAADIQLPAAKKTGGMPALEAIDQRSSATGDSFPSGVLTPADFATILWAATGQNRDGAKWTVPMAMGHAPYNKIYVTTEDGSFLYDWQANKLIQVSATDVRAILPIQDFAKRAPVALYIVGDGEKLAAFSKSGLAHEFSAVLAGAMSQNVYLAAEAVGVGARVVYSVDRKGMTEHFKLDDKDLPFFAIFLGKK